MINTDLKSFAGMNVKGLEVKKLLNKVNSYNESGTFPNDIEIRYSNNGEYIFDQSEMNFSDDEFYSVTFSCDIRNYVTEVIIKK